MTKENRIIHNWRAQGPGWPSNQPPVTAEEQAGELGWAQFIFVTRRR